MDVRIEWIYRQFFKWVSTTYLLAVFFLKPPSTFYFTDWYSSKAGRWENSVHLLYMWADLRLYGHWWYPIHPNHSLGGFCRAPKKGWDHVRKRQNGALLIDALRGSGRSRSCEAPGHHVLFGSSILLVTTRLSRLIPRSRLTPISHEHPTWSSLGHEHDADLISQEHYPETSPSPQHLTPCPHPPISAFSVLATSVPFSRTIRDYYSLPCTKCWVERRRKEGKKNSPWCNSYTGKSYKQFRALKLMHPRANEKRVNITADSNKNVLNVYSTYLFIFRKFAMLPSPLLP